MLALAVERDAERREELLDLARLEFEPAQALDEAEVDLEGRIGLWRLTRDGDLACLAAAKLTHEVCGKLEPGNYKLGIDAALETIARVRLDIAPAPGAGRALGIEIGRLDEDVGGGVGHAGLFAADHAANPEHFGVIGNDAHVAVNLVGLAVEREKGLASPPEPRADRAFELVGVIDVKRAGAVVGDVVGDIDQRIDRPDPDCFQLSLQPFRRRAVLDIAHQPPGEDGAGVGSLSVEFELDRDWVLGAAFDGFNRVFLELAEASGSEVARDAAYG